MRIWVSVLWLVVLSGLSHAQNYPLAAALDAYESGDFDGAIVHSKRVLAAGARDKIALEAREIIALSEYDTGRVGQAFVEELRALDRDMALGFGGNAPERLGLLNILSTLEYDLGQGENRLTDIQIVRIAKLHPSAIDDLLVALRNITVDYSNQNTPKVSAKFAAQYEFYAAEMLGSSDPVLMEATAMLSYELLRSGADVRGLQKFALYPLEGWARFGESDADADVLVNDMITAVAEVLSDETVDWQAKIGDMFERIAVLESTAEQIVELTESGSQQEAFAMMETYLTDAPPEDPMAASFMSAVMQFHLLEGQFAKARPYLAGLFSYPSAYLATLEVSLPAITARLARGGGVEDDLLEAMLIKSLEIEEILRDPDPSVRIDLNYQLGLFRTRTGALQAALAAHSRALAIMNETGHDDPEMAKLSLNGVAMALLDAGQIEQAESALVQLRTLAKETGDADALSAALGNLALLEVRRGNPKSAIAFSKEKIAVEERRAPQDPEGVAIARVNLAVVHFADARSFKPEIATLLRQVFASEIQSPTLRQSLVMLFNLMITEEGGGVDALRQDAVFAAIPAETKAVIVAGLAEAAFYAGDMEDAASLVAFGFEIAADPADSNSNLKLTEGRIAQAQGDRIAALLAFRSVTDRRLPVGVRPTAKALAHLPHHLSAAFELALDPVTGQDLRFHNEMFQLAQLASATVVSGALNDAIARNQSDGALSTLLREQQVLTREIATLDGAITRARYDGKSAEGITLRAQQARDRHAELSIKIGATSPALANVSDLNPVRMEDVAKRLRPDELLIVYTTSDVTLADGTAGSFVIALSQEQIFAAALPSRSNLAEMARDLRCSAALTDPACASSANSATRGSFERNPEKGPALPPFDTGVAYKAYTTLLAPLEELLNQKKRLIIVSDEALISLPFHLTLKAPLDPASQMRDGHWLIRDHSVEIFPSVASFVVMRDTAGIKRATNRFLGIGDPLIGVQRDGPIEFDCDAEPALFPTAPLSNDAMSRGLGVARTKAVGALAALPDTRCELHRIAQQFDENSTVLLQGKANESDIKRLSETGQLRDYSVISFATHGLIAGEIGINESGLVLTPPALPTARDDGLLTTGEIAALDLDSDFVILSACNTGSGDSQNREGLSGMAAAFFFAGARSLLVSHWPVYSDAAVDLTTRSFSAMHTEPGMARADAVRIAMLSILDDPQATARQSHPSYWAPFVIVGDGLGR